MKTCRDCCVEKPRADFYAHPKAKDGLLAKCKECHKAGVRKNYAEKRPQYQAYEAERNDTEKRRQFRRDAGRRHYWSCHEKARARTELKRAVREGRVQRQPCKVCSDPRSDAHHHDYSKPLDVEWMCFKCHRAEHGHVSLSGYVSPVKYLPATPH